jgi:type I restriction enzyme S subunit
MSNVLPDGWAGHRQGDVADFSNGKAYKLTEWEKVGTPVIRLQNLTGTGKNYYYSNLKLPERQYCESGDLLYMWSATFGAHIWKGPKAIYHYHIWKITCNEEDLTKGFLYQLLGYKTAEWLNQSNGMGILHITKGGMEELKLILPPLPEQQKIAQILTSVDEVIEKTQAQIDKLKDLKTGMMQELLTKGIGHVEFKDSPVGRIPVGWEVETIEGLNILVLDGDRGKEYPKEKDFFQHEHCLFLSAKNVTKKGFRFDVSMFITEKKDNAMRKGKLKRGDIVITTRGTLGNIAYFNTEIPFENVRINSGMAIIRNDKTSINTEFLNILLHSPLVNEQTELLAFGSAIPQLTIGLLKNLNIPVPSIEEQNKISTTINLVSHKIILIESKLTSLKNTKKALMQDLLTGKVRVNTEQSNTALAVG